jgi:E3 ubiquitin-protein ligase XBAT32/33
MLLILIAYTFTMLLLKRLTPLLVARSWHKTSIEGILSKQPENRMRILPSPYLCLPLMSIVKIAR